MPKLDKKWYLGKTPILQIKILKHIALNGRLSQKKATICFECTPPTISEALHIMRKKRLIEQDTTSPPPDFKSGERHKKFYKLTPQGLIAFINGNPSPYEFWIALMQHCTSKFTSY